MGTELLFGEVRDSGVILNQYGRVVIECWDELPTHYPHVVPDEFVVMPNHVHGIVILSGRDRAGVGAGLRPAQPIHGLSEIVRALKAFSARRINQLRESQGAQVWQRSFHERIIRGPSEMQRIRKYIRDNPSNWQGDEYYKV
jgi:REP element-mobilizing transposase RayT